MKYLFILGLLILPIILYSQQERSDVIYLKNGSIYRGRIINFQENKSIDLLIVDDTLKLNIPENVIKKVVQNVKQTSFKNPIHYSFNDKGLYTTIYTGINPGFYSSSKWNKTIHVGANASISMGYQWNKWYGLGVGIGFENLYFDHSNIPIFIESKGYLNKKRISPYYNVALGYDFATSADAYSVKGNIYFHPALGLKFGINSSFDFLFDVGLRIQNTTRNYEYPNWDGTTLNYSESWTYKRIALRFGIKF